MFFARGIALTGVAAVIRRAATPDDEGIDNRQPNPGVELL